MEPCRLLTLDRPVHTDSEWRIDPTYRFGSTHNGTRDPHHGVEFYNPQGTPALAAGAGVVVFAGEDFPVPVGPVPGFYGKAVILKINTPSPPDLFVLYGHLSEILVTEGQIVASGQLVGLIGATGYATGAHLHFEVRVSENSYEMVQNPELWLRPADGTGTLAGRLPRDVSSIEIRSVQLDREGNLLWFLQPYQFADTEDFFHPGLDEMLAVTDLPAGLYTVKVVYNGVELRTIRIHPNRLSWFAFDSSEPPASPCLW